MIQLNPEQIVKPIEENSSQFFYLLHDGEFERFVKMRKYDSRNETSLLEHEGFWANLLVGYKENDKGERFYDYLGLDIKLGVKGPFNWYVKSI